MIDEWHPTKNGKLTPSDVTQWTRKKVWWRCSKNKEHEWEASVGSRTGGHGCPHCTRINKAKNRLKQGEKDLATAFPDVAKFWHPTLNGPLTANMVSEKSFIKAWWICECGKAYQEIINRECQKKVHKCKSCKKKTPF